MKHQCLCINVYVVLFLSSHYINHHTITQKWLYVSEFLEGLSKLFIGWGLLIRGLEVRGPNAEKFFFIGERTIIARI